MPVAEPPELFIDRSVGLLGVPRHFREAWPTTVRTVDEVFGAGKVADEVWMARADAEGWIAVCKDDKIRRRTGERELMSRGTLRVFCLANGNVTRDEMIAWLTEAHPALLKQAPEPGPWMLGVYAHGRTERLKLYA